MNAPYNLPAATNGFNYGAAPYVWGTYASEATPHTFATREWALNLAPSTGALSIAADVQAGGSFVVGLAFESGTSCVDASAYAGVSFNMAGDLGGCVVHFFVDDAEDTSTVYSVPGKCTTPTCATDTSTAYSVTGKCTAPACTTASYPVTQTMVRMTGQSETGPIQIPFTSFGNGTPQARVDPASILSLHWVFAAP
jgi:hypothetical protein